jgi:WG repeat protein
MRVVLSILALHLMIPAITLPRALVQRQLVPIQVGEKWGYADNTNTLVIAPSFDEAEPFSEGLAAIAIRIGPKPEEEQPDSPLRPLVEGTFRWGFIDGNGHSVVPPQYTTVGSFSEGLARVSVGEGFGAMWGYINTAGQMVIKPQFYHAEDFKNARAAVWRGKVNLKWGRKHVSVTKVEFHGKDGFIDRYGKFTEIRR